MMKKRKQPTELQDGSIDAGLHLLAALTPRGVERTQAEIAFVCGCSMQNIQQIERRALRKIRAALIKKKLDQIF
jgi:DNA-directed RNA polymerase sigma subunit (sigma70/sigma32)